MLAEIYGTSFLYFSAFGAAVLFAFLCSVVAKVKGYNRLLWAALGFFTFFIALIVLAVLPVRNVADVDERMKQQRSWAIFALLIGFVLLVYIIAMLKMGQIVAA